MWATVPIVVSFRKASDRAGAPVRSVSGWMRYWGTGCWAPTCHCSAADAATATARNRDTLMESPPEGKFNLGNHFSVVFVYTRCQPASGGIRDTCQIPRERRVRAFAVRVVWPPPHLPDRPLRNQHRRRLQP